MRFCQGGEKVGTRTHSLAEFEIRRSAIQGVRRVRRIGDERGGVVPNRGRVVSRLEGRVALEREGRIRNEVKHRERSGYERAPCPSLSAQRRTWCVRTEFDRA